MGSSPVQQFLFFEKEDGIISTAFFDPWLEESFGVSTLEEVEEKQLNILQNSALLPLGGSGSIRSLRRTFFSHLWAPKVPPAMNPANPAAQREASKAAPNISLNLNPKNRGAELYLAAFIGVCAQAAVLIFGGLATYQWKFLKGGQEVSSYAYPLTATGALMLVIGMFICASIVEGSTRETEWVNANDGNYRMHCLWLQRGRVLGSVQQLPYGS
jgi:hypothetical protein